MIAVEETPPVFVECAICYLAGMEKVSSFLNTVTIVAVLYELECMDLTLAASQDPWKPPASRQPRGGWYHARDWHVITYNMLSLTSYLSCRC